MIGCLLKVLQQLTSSNKTLYHSVKHHQQSLLLAHSDHTCGFLKRPGPSSSGRGIKGGRLLLSDALAFLVDTTSDLSTAADTGAELASACRLLYTAFETLLCLTASANCPLASTAAVAVSRHRNTGRTAFQTNSCGDIAKNHIS